MGGSSLDKNCKICDISFSTRDRRTKTCGSEVCLRRARNPSHKKSAPSLKRHYKKVNPGEIVGIIGDTHMPYVRHGYLEFCQETFQSQGVTRVIHAGDLIDHHALSFHDSEPSLRGAAGEYEAAKEQLQPWFDAFPRLEIIRGNHDKIPARQLTKIGMDPDKFMRPMAEVYGFPPGWIEVDNVFSNGVLYHHGETAVGVGGFRRDSRDRMCNTVTGHVHTNFGVSYTATDHRLVFGCAVGCGIDNRSMAFAYGKNFKLKSIVGCAVVSENGTLPICFPMPLGSKP